MIRHHAPTSFIYDVLCACPGGLALQFSFVSFVEFERRVDMLRIQNRIYACISKDETNYPSWNSQIQPDRMLTQPATGNITTSKAFVIFLHDTQESFLKRENTTCANKDVFSFPDNLNWELESSLCRHNISRPLKLHRSKVP